MLPGAKLILQRHHHHHTKHWIVVKGAALVAKGEGEVLLTENQSTYIPVGVKHRLENPSKTDLELIEVHLAATWVRTHILRFEDAYGRG